MQNSYNIVLLEDNYVIRQIISIALRDLSQSSQNILKLYTSSNGVEGLGYIYVTSPNLIIIDTTLPKYSGKEVVDFLRHNDKFKNDQVQIIILEEGKSHVSYPKHFSVLDKTAKHFTQELLALICYQADIKSSHLPSLLARIYTQLIYLTSQNDRSLHSSHSLAGKLLSWPVRKIRELAITLLLSVVFIFKARLPNENIEQEQSDLVHYRVKYYPTLVISASAFLLLILQASALVLSQLALLTQVNQPSLAAATFVVDSTADSTDFSAGDGVCDVDDGAGDGPCTLRAAIAEANALVGADTINFNIPGAGPHVIQPASALPAVTESLIIDASSEPTADCSTLSLQVELDGTLAGTVDGLTFNNADSGAIRGLVINKFRDGIVLTNGSTTNTISCNIIGLDADGSTVQANTSDGIVINTTSSSNILGGDTAADRNIIGGNSYHGISIDLSDATIIKNNYVGTDVTGMIRKTNGDPGGGYGLRITSSNNTAITSNVITGSLLYDISIDNSDDVSILGNYVGTDKTGNTALNFNSSFSSLSVLGDSDNFTLGGYLQSERNVFSEGYIEIKDDDAATQMSNIQIINNYFGLSASGNARISQVSPYFAIDKGVGTATLTNVLIDSNFMVGSYDTNPSYSCRIESGGLLSGSNSTNFTITNNHYGYDSSGTTPLGVCEGQIALFSKIDGGVIANNTLREMQIRSQGTNISISDNEILNSKFQGILVSSSNTSISGNTIDGSSIRGIWVANSPSNVSISGNQISNGQSTGVTIESTASNVTLLDNLIYDNVGLGIDLAGNGVTANDANDTDSGANDLLNFPVLTSATSTTYDTNTDIEYSLDTGAGNYRVQFFYSSSADATGYGEGQVLLCSQDIAHVGGSADYSVTCPVGATPGSFISATTTEDSGGGNYDSTSEFAQNIQPTVFGIDGSIDAPDFVATNSSVLITVTDTDLNNNPLLAETTQILLSSDTTGELETVTLTEDAVNSGIFIGSHASQYGLGPGVDNDGIMVVKPADQLMAVYADAETSSGAGQNRIDTTLIINAGPSAAADSAEISSGNSVVISVLSNDSDPENSLDPSSLSITVFPLHGNVSIDYANSTIVYTAFSDYTGADEITYEICDDAAVCTTATISLSVVPFVPSATPTPTVEITGTLTPEPTPTLEPTPEPSVLRPTPTAEPQIAISPTPLPSIPQVVILPQTGSTQGLISALFGEQDIGTMIATTAIALPAISVIITTTYAYPGYLFYAFVWLRSSRKYPTWGIVYDQDTLTPIAFAHLALMQGDNLIQERVTDLSGRFGFIADRGEYTLRVNHSNYQETIIQVRIEKAEELLVQNIIMHPKITKGMSSRALLRRQLRENLTKLNMLIFAFGFCISVIATLLNPVLFNFLVLFVYIVQIGFSTAYHWYKTGVRNWGYIYDIDNNQRIKGAFVRIYDVIEQNQIDVQMTDKSGRYGFLVEPGHYLLSVDRSGYAIPSRKSGSSRFYLTSEGKWLTNITVKRGSTINLAIPADKTENNNSVFPSPFGR